MMTSSNGNIFSITGPLWGESTGDWWISLTKAGHGELWCFLWSTPEHTVQQTIDTLLIWDAIVLIIASMKYNRRITFGFYICYCSINMSVKPGSLVAVVGSVGAGKSTLLSAILGETEKISGQVKVNVSIGDDNKTIFITNQCHNMFLCQGPTSVISLAVKHLASLFINQSFFAYWWYQIRFRRAGGIINGRQGLSIYHTDSTSPCIPQGTIAYAAQQAWVQNATLKNNILFHSDFEEEKYEKVLDNCCLRADIAILPGADITEIGEKVNCPQVFLVTLLK